MTHFLHSFPSNAIRCSSAVSIFGKFSLYLLSFNFGLPNQIFSLSIVHKAIFHDDIIFTNAVAK